jgi:hypothetical protein
MASRETPSSVRPSSAKSRKEESLHEERHILSPLPHRSKGFKR